MAVDLRKAADRADKALKEVHEAILAVDALVKEAEATEHLITTNMATLESQRTELERLDVSISTARDRYQAAKDEARRARDEADATMADWQRELAEARGEYERKRAELAKGLQEAEEQAALERLTLTEQMAALREALGGLERLREQARRQLA